MNKEMITYKFRLRPTKSQQIRLIRWMGACRFLYNCALEERIEAYKKKISLNYFSQQNELPACKKLEGFEWLKDVPSQSLQMSLRNLDTAYKNFFEGRAKFPKRKKKGRCADSICFPQGARFLVSNISNKKSVITGIPKIKEGLKFIQHRKIDGVIKQVTVTRKNRDEWYISITCERSSCGRIKTVDHTKRIGIDLGIAKTIATTEKDYHLDIDGIKSIEKEIARVQKRLAKTKKFSKKWHYFQRIIRKKHSKITRKRKDFLHKVSTEICKNHAIVCLENLKIKNMSKSSSGSIEEPGKMVAQKSGLNRSILRQGWGIFRIFCEYKTNKFGGELILVSPKNTSRKCSDCGYTDLANRPTQAIFSCRQCGHYENADGNAAKNILALGLESLDLAS